MESWKWALIGVGIAVFVAINAMVIYCLYYRRNTEAINVLSKEEQEHQTVDRSTIDEGVVAIDPKQMTTLQQQQQDYTTAVQTALSPPRPHHIITKDKVLTTPTQIIQEGEEEEPQALRVFSLSPLHVQSSEAKPSEKTNSMCSTSTTRSMTPFQYASTIFSIWRGPTPPWTQHPDSVKRYSTLIETNKQKTTA